ncbi:MAG: hypothetical protein LBD31_09520 [Treponema sp.]|jgi:hypothetical protein|nr:hypothetical protein [Treponema sp.]
MTVTAWSNGGGGYGIRAGKHNRDAFFNPSWKRIEVEIDGVLHTFKLTPGFWNDCPEFRGSVIKEWLQRNHAVSWVKGKPPKFNLEAAGERRFHLEP